MTEKNAINTRARQAAEHQIHDNGSYQGPPKGFKKVVVGTIITLIVILAAIGGLLFWQLKGSTNANAVKIDESSFQAVFLTNGQVYFGKLKNADGAYANLENIYYLQVQQAVQPADTSSTDSSQVSLTKLGQELHGPQDQMSISTDQILFWENLKSDSTVVKAISDYQAK